jgi:hypothetical protein
MTATGLLKEALRELDRFEVAGHVRFVDRFGMERDIFDVCQDYRKQYEEFCNSKLSEYIERANASLNTYPQGSVEQIKKGLTEFDLAAEDIKIKANNNLHYAESRVAVWEQVATIIQEVIDQ